MHVYKCKCNSVIVLYTHQEQPIEPPSLVQFARHNIDISLMMVGDNAMCLWPEAFGAYVSPALHCAFGNWMSARPLDNKSYSWQNSSSKHIFVKSVCWYSQMPG